MIFRENVTVCDERVCQKCISECDERESSVRGYVLIFKGGDVQRR